MIEFWKLGSKAVIYSLFGITLVLVMLGRAGQCHSLNNSGSSVCVWAKTFQPAHLKCSLPTIGNIHSWQLVLQFTVKIRQNSSWLCFSFILFLYFNGQRRATVLRVGKKAYIGPTFPIFVFLNDSLVYWFLNLWLCSKSKFHSVHH